MSPQPLEYASYQTNGPNDKSSSFSFIFWGMVIVLIDISINGFDLLHDTAGFILIAIACGNLSEISRLFSTAGVLSWVLAILAVVEMFIARNDQLFISIVSTLCMCGLIWFLLGGIMDLAILRDRLDLHQRASNRRVAYLVLTLIGMFGSFMIQSSREAAMVLGIPILILFLILIVMILHLLHVARRELSRAF